MAPPPGADGMGGGDGPMVVQMQTERHTADVLIRWSAAHLAPLCRGSEHTAGDWQLDPSAAQSSRPPCCASSRSSFCAQRPPAVAQPQVPHGLGGKGCAVVVGNAIAD